MGTAATPLQQKAPVGDLASRDAQPRKEGFSSAVSQQAAARGAEGTSRLAGASAPATVASAGNPNPYAPDGYVSGVSSGSLVATKVNIGVFSISPSLNPADKDASVFVSVPRASHPNLLRLGIPGTDGGVGTYNFAKKRVELGYGAAGVIDVGATKILGFVNARGQSDLVDANGNLKPHATGVISGNVGFAFQLNRPAAAALTAAGGALAATPLAEIAPAVLGAGRLAAGSEAIANAWAGAGYRVELHVKDGALEGIYYKGQKIVDLEAFLRSAFEGRQRYKPPVEPNLGFSSIANLNYTTQLIFGTSPWDLARTSGGSNHGNGAVAVANQWRTVISDYGMPILSKLPPDVQLTVIRGPSNNAEAGKAVDAILKATAEEDNGRFGQVLEKLVNSYDLDFGTGGVAFFNNPPLGLPKPRPNDYDFVRSVFQGDYRYPTDNPPPPEPGGSRPRL